MEAPAGSSLGGGLVWTLREEAGWSLVSIWEDPLSVFGFRSEVLPEVVGGTPLYPTQATPAGTPPVGLVSVLFRL